MSELDSSSEWLASAPSENAQYQQAMSEYEKAAKEKMAASTADGSGSGTDAQAAAEPGTYKWAQTSEELEVTVTLPEGTTKKDLVVKFGAKKLSVALKARPLPHRRR